MNLLLLSSSVKELRKIKHLVYFLPQIERHNPFSVGKNLTEVKAEQHRLFDKLSLTKWPGGRLFLSSATLVFINRSASILVIVCKTKERRKLNN